MLGSITLQSEQGIFHKLKNLDWVFILLVVMVASVGFTALYSAAGGSFSPWAEKQMQRFSVFLLGMILIALVDIRWWYKCAWWFYVVGFILLVIVEVFGHIGMGAQRWINLGFMKVQPSELMKIALVIALSRYFHSATPEDAYNVSVRSSADDLCACRPCYAAARPWHGDYDRDGRNGDNFCCGGTALAFYRWCRRRSGNHSYRLALYA